MHSLESLNDLNKTDLLFLSANNSETFIQAAETSLTKETFDTMNETPISERDTNESLDQSTNTIEPTASINQELLDNNSTFAPTEASADKQETIHHETYKAPEASASQISADNQQTKQHIPDENNIPIEVTDYQTGLFHCK